MQGKLLGQRAGAINQQSQSIDQFNKSVDLQIAQSELNVQQGNAAEEFITGGLSGTQLGMSLKSLMKENELTDELINSLKNEGSFKGSAYFGQWLKKKKNPFLGRVDNPYYPEE